MSGIRSKNTRPEWKVRRCLHARGFRFRLNVKRLPGKPDVVLPKYRLAIFVHGCFWHRHPGCRLTTTPASNTDEWQAKFDANVERDTQNQQQLRDAGWRLLILWECGLRKDDSALDWLPEWICGNDLNHEWPNIRADEQEAL